MEEKDAPLNSPVYKSLSHKIKRGAVHFLVLVQWLYAAPRSQDRVCAGIDSVISQRRRLLHSTVGFRAGMMMVLGISHGRRVPLSTLMRVASAIGQGETLQSAHFATAGQ